MYHVAIFATKISSKFMTIFMQNLHQNKQQYIIYFTQGFLKYLYRNKRKLNINWGLKRGFAPVSSFKWFKKITETLRRQRIGICWIAITKFSTSYILQAKSDRDTNKCDLMTIMWPLCTSHKYTCKHTHTCTCTIGMSCASRYAGSR